MNKLIAVSLFFLAAVPAGAYKAGDVMPCDSTMAIEGMCKYGGTYTVTAQDVATDQRNNVEYQAGLVSHANAVAHGSDTLEWRLGMWDQKANRPYPGATDLLSKEYTVYDVRSKSIIALPLYSFYGAGEGPFAGAIFDCGDNKLFASLNDPVASCDMTAQCIVAHQAWMAANPFGGLLCGGGPSWDDGCYTWINGVKTKLSPDDARALRARQADEYNFWNWSKKNCVLGSLVAPASNSAAASAKKLSGGGFKPFATGSSTPNAAGQTGGLVIGGGVHPETAGQIAQ